MWVDFDEDDIEAWGLTKRRAWLLSWLLCPPLLLLWYREYNYEKYLRSLAEDE